MKYPLYLLMAEVAKDPVVDDEIDELFGQLEVIEPPETLVGDILASAARLAHRSCVASPLLQDMDGLVVCHDMCNPS